MQTSVNRARADACLPRTPNPQRSAVHPYEVSYSSALREVYSPSSDHRYVPPQSADSAVSSSHLGELANITNSADILVVAVGYPHLINRTWIKPGAIILDVGINVVDDEVEDNSRPSAQEGSRPGSRCDRASSLSGDDTHNLHVTGDVDLDDVLGIASAVTPVPGGLGPMTIAAVLHNTVHAAALHLGLMQQGGK